MLYHGIDLIEVGRINRAASRWGQRFLQRVFTPAELRDCGGRGPSLAARWAAKEATAKALGVGVRGLGAMATGGAPSVAWLDMEVAREVGGKPSLLLHGAAAARAAALGWTATALSLSHTSRLAIASVVALAPAQEPDHDLPLLP